MRIVTDEDRCCGSGQCVLLAPDVFDQRDEDGIVWLLNPDPPEDQHDAVREAASMCPSSAIELRTSREEP